MKMFGNFKLIDETKTKRIKYKLFNSLYSDKHTKIGLGVDIVVQTNLWDEVFVMTTSEVNEKVKVAITDEYFFI